MKLLPAIVTLFAAALLLFTSPISADVQDIVAVGDATIFGDNVVGANGQGHLFVGSTNLGHARRALVIFDLSSIPPGALITNVNFRLQCTRAPVGVHPVSLHRMTKSWTEGSATGTGTGGGQPSAISVLDVSWRYASFTVAATDTFLTPGGDFDASASATLSVSGVGQYDWNSPGLESDVSAWVNSPSSNFGWILVGNESASKTARRFDSREDAMRPVLSVEFTPPTPVEVTTWGRVKALYRQ